MQILMDANSAGYSSSLEEFGGVGCEFLITQ